MNKIGCISLAIGTALATSAFAGGPYDGTVLFNGTSPFGGPNGGGEFSFTSTGGPSLFGNFQTFCLEVGESLNPNGTTEYNFILNDTALNNGGNGPDPLDARTAALYEAFWTGTLAMYGDNGGFSGTLTRRQTAAALQAAIWQIEDERNIVDNSLTAEQILLANEYVAISTGLADGGLGGRVRVMNMYTLGGGNAQDVLILVPLPQAGALAGLGLAGIAIRRRRA